MLYRTIRYGMHGEDVYAHKRGIARMLKEGRLVKLNGKEPAEQRTFMLGNVADVKLIQKLEGIDQTGVIGPKTHPIIMEYFDDVADLANQAYAKSLEPKYIEPLQGFSSLHASLWDCYTLGRKLGLSDLGTFNPDSRLPSGKKSDHAVFPAIAFDLGFDPDTGWANLKAREFFIKMEGRTDVEYVILGDKIWSRSQGRHTYTSGGHLNHVHVSGIR